MGIPTGYEKLAAIGIAWKGDYVSGNPYRVLNGVYYDGSSYVSLKDNPNGPPIDDKVNWQYMAKGYLTDEKIGIVVMEDDIPVSDRKPQTYYLRVTDRQSITTSDTVRVSPSMGVKIIQ